MKKEEEDNSSYLPIPPIFQFFLSSNSSFSQVFSLSVRCAFLSLPPTSLCLFLSEGIVLLTHKEKMICEEPITSFKRREKVNRRFGSWQQEERSIIKMTERMRVKVSLGGRLGDLKT